jgi:hypothetical protein
VCVYIYIYICVCVCVCCIFVVVRIIPALEYYESISLALDSVYPFDSNQIMARHNLAVSLESLGNKVPRPNSPNRMKSGNTDYRIDV